MMVAGLKPHLKMIHTFLGQHLKEKKEKRQRQGTLDEDIFKLVII